MPMTDDRLLDWQRWDFLWRCVRRSPLEDANKERDDIIEECARLLEARYDECNTLNLLHGAAAIRALKDKNT